MRMNAVNAASDSPLAAAARYDRTTIVLHWVTAVLVVVLWLSAQVIDVFPRGAPRNNMRSVHMLLGVTLGAVLVWRVGWRLLAGARLPAVGHPLLARVASATHIVLYALLVAEVVFGLCNAWVRGDSVFNLFSIPSFAPGDRALAKQINGVHDWVANTILIVAALHAVGGLVHHYVWKDEVLRRMLPRRGTPDPRQRASLDAPVARRP
jgi:cytochrome b561